MKTPGDYKPEGLKTTRDWHVYHVYNDLEFITEVNDAPESRYGTIAEKYAITPKDVIFFIARKYIYLEGNTDKKSMLILDGDKEQLVLNMDPDITHEEYLSQWKVISAYKRSLFKLPRTKRKPTYNTNLVYTIFKARNRGLTFKEIYLLYTDGKLPGYSGSTSYNSEENLERFYRKHKPDS
jgi:hypothetical protein